MCALFNYSKISKWVDKAGLADCDLVAFGEALVPGYPFWLEHTNGAKLFCSRQEAMYAHYLRNAVDIAGKILSIVPFSF